MKFSQFPPGAEGKPEGIPVVMRRRATTATPQRTAPQRAAPLRAASPTTSAVETSVRRPARQAATFAAGWLLMFVPAAFVTQIWAGASTSPGQGGGFSELMGWVALFGVIATVLVAVGANRHGAGDAGERATMGSRIGFAVGAVIAIVWFTTKGGPSVGDWWVGPCVAALGAVIGSFTSRRSR